MPRYAVTVTATITGIAWNSFKVDAESESEARAEAEALAEQAVYGWEMSSGTLEVKSGTCVADECELVEGTDDE